MDHIVGENYFGHTGGHVLCFGAGGSAVATLLHLINKENKDNRPERFIVVNRSRPRLDRMEEMVVTLDTDMEMEYIRSQDPSFNDEIMANLPEGSIVINATGMGKDIPGSPVSDQGLFSKNGNAWEFDYRGQLDFMYQALRQADSRNVFVEDGWVDFLHGWTQVIAQVLHIDIDDELFARLDEGAATTHK